MKGLGAQLKEVKEPYISSILIFYNFMYNVYFTFFMYAYKKNCVLVREIIFSFYWNSKLWHILHLETSFRGPTSLCNEIFSNIFFYLVFIVILSDQKVSILLLYNMFTVQSIYLRKRHTVIEFSLNSTHLNYT